MNLVTGALGGALFLTLLAGPVNATAEPSRLQQLEARVEALSARLNAMPASRVGTAAVSSDIVGLWKLKSMQNEVSPGQGWQVRSYGYKGTINFFANGNYTSKLTEFGIQLVNGGEAGGEFTNPEEVVRGKWRLVGGNQVVLDGDTANPLDLDAGLTVMTYSHIGSDPNPLYTMGVATKQPAP